MIPHDQNQPQIDPRKLVFSGRSKELYDLIRRTGYVPADDVFRDFCQSLKAGKPWMISGERGSGKTAFPEALAESCNLTICIVSGRDGLSQEEILYGWDHEEQSAWMNENIRLAQTAPEGERKTIMENARLGKWKREFLILGEMGSAYDLAGEASRSDGEQVPPVLILDESDKFGASIEDAMLMPLERGVIYIPRLTGGFVGISDRKCRPFVVTTTNDLRHKLSAPFISRHLFTRFATPPLTKELEILRVRCPAASSQQIAIVMKLLDGIRGIAGIEDYPSLRESIELLGALERDGIEELSESALVGYFCYFVKTAAAQEFLKLQLDYLLLTANAYHPEIDNWLASRDKTYSGSYHLTESIFVNVRSPLHGGFND